MTPFFKRNRRRRDESETVQVSPASAPLTSAADIGGTEAFGGAPEPDIAPAESSPVEASPAESAASESRVPMAKQLVEMAYQEWWTSLSETATASARPLSAADPTVIDLSSPHPTGGAYLYAGIPTLLSSLIREESSLRVAYDRLNNLTHHIREMSENYGYVPVTLAIGEAWWSALSPQDSGTAEGTPESSTSVTTTASVESPATSADSVVTPAESVADSAAPSDVNKADNVSVDGAAIHDKAQDVPATDNNSDTDTPATGAGQASGAEPVVVESPAEATSSRTYSVTERRSEPVLLRTVRLVASGENDALITLTAKCEVNPVVLHALREAGVDSAEIARIIDMAGNPRLEHKTLTRITDLGRYYLRDFGYEARVLLGSFIHPGQALLTDLEAMKPYIESSGVMAALAGDEATKRLSAAPLPPASMVDRAPEAERGAGDRDVAELATIEAVASGRSIVIDTSPGSEKVGTLAGIVADAAASGRSVLYIPRGASAGRQFIDHMQGLGLDDLVLDFSDMEEVPMRLRTGLRLRHDEPEDERVFEIRKKLTQTRKELSDYVDALHRTEPEWNESVYSLLERLAKLTADEDGPASRIRLNDSALRNLRGSYDAIEEQLNELARLGTFSPEGGASAWTGSNIDTTEAGEEALARATRIAQETLPVVMAQSQRVAGESRLARATTLDEWIEQIRMLNGIAKTLDVFLAKVYERSVSDLVAATATREWREAQGIAMRGTERRRLTRQAREFVRPGATVANIHDELIKVEALRVTWRRYSAEAGWPELPDGMPQIKATAAEVYREAESLEKSLAPGIDLSAMRFEELLALVKQLAAGTDVMATLPRRNALVGELKNKGLGPIIDDFTKRAVTVDKVHEELTLIYVNSVFEQLVVRTPTLANVGPADLTRMSEQLRLLDKEHTATLVGPVHRAVVRIMRETISRRRDETMDFDAHLARYGSGGLRDAIANHSRLVQVARPVWTIPSMMTAEFVPPMPWVDLVIMDEMEAVDLPSAISLLMRGRQVVVMGDLRRALEKSAISQLAQVLPVCELPTLRAPYDELTTLTLREQGYADVLPMIPRVTRTDCDGSGDGDSSGAVGNEVQLTPSESGDSVAPLLADLAERLESAGWMTAAHFGYDDGVRVPLAVGSPRLHGTWRVAVLLDDENYISEPSLRRRDRYWVDRLESRGWAVFQTFSSSLFIDPEGQAKEVISILEKAEAVELGRAGAVSESAGSAGDEAGENSSDVSPTGGTTGVEAVEVIEEPRPRGPRPHLTPGLPLAAYTDDQLDEVMAWIISDGLSRSEDELVQCLREELDLHRRGVQVDAVLHNVVRRSGTPNVSPHQDDEGKGTPPISLLGILENTDEAPAPVEDVVAKVSEDEVAEPAETPRVEDGTEK